MQIAFVLDDVQAEGYIENDTVKVALVNEYDLKFFEWFHYLAPGSTFDECMAELKNIASDAELSAALHAVDLSEFSRLSDVSIDDVKILATNRRLQFKIDEHDIFGAGDRRYYVPSINEKLPLTIG